MSLVLEELQKILANLKKTPNRKYSINSLKTKLTKIKDLKYQFHDLIEEDAEQLPLTLEFNKIYSKVKEILENKLKIKEDEEEESEEEEEEYQDIVEQDRVLERKMSSFNLETAIKAIPLFTGVYKELDSFLKIIEIIHKNLNTEGQKQLIELVYFIKLTDSVKTALCGCTEPKHSKHLNTYLQHISKQPTRYHKYIQN